MACFCSVPLNSLALALPRIPSLAGLVPPMSLSLIAAVGPPAFTLAPMLSVSAVASTSANAALVANLSAMAGLSAGLKAAFGTTLAAALSAMASTQASLSAAIGGFNANGGLLQSLMAMLLRLLQELLNLVRLSGLVMAIRATFAIDMRASGAIAALQARLAAQASVSVKGGVQLCAIAALMSTLGFQANAQGALALNAQAAATASLLAGLPTLNLALFNPLALLQALLAMLESIHIGLGVNLLAPTAALDLRLALSALPLSAMAQLSAQVSASATANVALAAGGAASLNLAMAASAQLSAAAQLSMLLSVMAKGGFGFPAGSCHLPCPLALLQGQPPMPTLAAAGGAMSALPIK